MALKSRIEMDGRMGPFLAGFEVHIRLDHEACWHRGDLDEAGSERHIRPGFRLIDGIDLA